MQLKIYGMKGYMVYDMKNRKMTIQTKKSTARQ